MNNEHYQGYTDGEGDQHLHAAASGKPGKKPGNKKRWLIIGAVVAGLAIAGAAVYFFVLADKKPAAKDTSKTQTTDTQQTTPTLTEEEASTPQTFKSTTLNVELTHRKDWTLRESGDKAEVIITSPSVPYVRKDGSSATGNFTVKIRNGANEAMKTTIEKAVAAQPSEVIAYTAPAESQRHYTNLSYGGTAEAFQFFLVTGSTEFKAGNPFALVLPLDEMYIIAGGFGPDTSDALAFDPVPKTALTNPVIVQAIDIVESLKVF
jgi:hypothetical protein